MMYWYLLGLAVGLYITWGGATKSSAKPYYYLHARASLLWKEQAHRFLFVSGLLVSPAMVILLISPSGID